ncbi:solute carrier family 35 member G1-like isoform X1 [Clavelina lepadiformis]|uniref:solute carrier family 35 member G1-like isoform X1 n=1 Tax=Clavelina lepadiformis TaxID=159417 RepID=UPI0040411955
MNLNSSQGIAKLAMTETSSLQLPATSLDEDNNTKKQHARPSMLGYTFAAFSSLLMAASKLFLKLAVGAEKTQAIIFRSIMQYLYLVPIITHKKINVFGPDWKTVLILILRGAAGSLAALFITMALDHLSLGTTLSIFYVYPALVGLFACVCLKEKCSVVRGILTVLTFVGLIFVTEPTFIFGGDRDEYKEYTESHVFGIFYASASAILAATTFTVIRKLGPGIHFSHSLIYNSVEGFIIVLLQLYISGKPIVPCWQHILMLFLSALFAIIGQLFTTLALQRERAGPVASINTSQLVFAIILEYIILGVVPTTFGFVGAGLILLSAIAQSLERTVKTGIRNRKKTTD